MNYDGSGGRSWHHFLMFLGCLFQDRFLAVLGSVLGSIWGPFWNQHGTKIDKSWNRFLDRFSVPRLAQISTYSRAMGAPGDPSYASVLKKKKKNGSNSTRKRFQQEKRWWSDTPWAKARRISLPRTRCVHRMIGVVKKDSAFYFRNLFLNTSSVCLLHACFLLNKEISLLQERILCYRLRFLYYRIDFIIIAFLCKLHSWPLRYRMYSFTAKQPMKFTWRESKKGQTNHQENQQGSLRDASARKNRKRTVKDISGKVYATRKQEKQTTYR